MDGQSGSTARRQRRPRHRARTTGARPGSPASWSSEGRYSRAVGTHALHPVVLSRRGGRFRRGPSALRRMPPQRLQRLPTDVAAKPWWCNALRQRHGHRPAPRAQPASHRMPWSSLPDGVFVDTDDGPAVIVGDHLAVFDEDAYTYRRLMARPVDGFRVGAHPAVERWRCCAPATRCRSISRRGRSVGPRLAEPGSNRAPRVGVAARRVPIRGLAFEELPHDGRDQRHRIAPPPDDGAHLREHLRPRVVLERQRLLCAGGIQPVGDKPVFVAVRITGTAGGQDVRQPPGRGQRQRRPPSAGADANRRRRSAEFRPTTSAVVAAANAAATSRTSTVWMRPSVGSALSKNKASPVNGIAPGSTLITPPRRRITHSRLEARSRFSAYDLVGAVEVRRPQRRVGAQPVGVAMRIARPVDRVAGGQHEARRMCACLRGAQQRRGRVDVDATRELGVAIDRRQNHRGQVDDHRRRDFGDQQVDLALVGQVRPVRLGVGGQRRGGFALGGGAEVGGDHAVAVGDQSAHGLRSDQAETACDKHLLGHRPQIRSVPQQTDMTFSKNESTMLTNVRSANDLRAPRWRAATRTRRRIARRPSGIRHSPSRSRTPSDR